jgi:DNA N-6-adenine-methyltransferase (Dam)
VGDGDLAMTTELTRPSVLRAQLTRITSPAEALTVAQLASRAKRVYEAIGHSVEECNEFAEIYLAASWKFGDLVDGTPRGRPEKKTRIDTSFPGTKDQRYYARMLRNGIKETAIPDYVKAATKDKEPASIAGCLQWNAPSKFDYLTGEYEWYTPAPIVEAARTVMGGGIDLDPASSAYAQRIVKATEYYTEKTNGLEHEWHGRVFLNPPFRHPTIRHFAEKLLASPDVSQAVWISNACIEVAWWQALAIKGLVCFHAGRIKFDSPKGPAGSPPDGQTLIYLGPNHETFRTVFRSFGVVLSNG